MTKIYAKCPNCDEIILVEQNKDADICEKCGKAFVTERAINLYCGQSEREKEYASIKKRHRWKSLGLALWTGLKCIGYLIYVVCLLWLFFDIVDNIGKNKK